MPAVKLSPLFNDQAVTSSGAPASGYKVYSYAAGSSTPLATYTDSAGNTPQTNPVILNANGYPTNPIWLQSGVSYKFILKDANDVQVGSPWDNITGVNDTTSTASQFQASGVIPTYVSATSFTLPGDQTTEFHVGRRAQFTTTAGTVYGTILTSAFSALTTVTMTMDSAQVLDSGLSAVNLSILRADKPALPKRDYVVNDLSASSLNGGALAGMRNRIINGNFAVNQRGVSGTVTLAAGAYGHDRWKAGAGGCTYTFVQSGIDTIITITAGSLMQVIEFNNVEGGVYRLSHQGTAQARVAVSGAATSGAYAATPLSTASASANLNITVEFTTGTVDRVQLEPGTIATPFERRPYGAELTLCQRYFRKTYAAAAWSEPSIAQWAGGNHTINVVFTNPVPMRAAPTITSFGAFSLLNCNAPSFASGDQQSYLMFVTATASGVVQCLSNSSGGITLSAEL